MPAVYLFRYAGWTTKERKLSGTFWLLRFSDRLVVITGISLLNEGRVRARRYAMEKNQIMALPERLADCGVDENKYESDTDVAGFSTAQQMQEALLRLKKEGKLPAILSVHSHRAEIREAATTNATIGGEPFDDGHVAWVTDIVEGKNGEPTCVMLEKPWGKPADRLGSQALTLDQAFNATRSLRAIEYMKYMEDWMRQVKIEGKYSSRKLYNKLISFAEGAVEHWQVQSKVNPDLAEKDKEATFTAFEKMREKLPTRERNRLPAELPAEFRRQILAEAANTIVPMRPEPKQLHRFI